MNKNNILYIVIPCYKEEEVLEKTSETLLGILNSLITNGKVSSQSRILFVNDGSKDKTFDIIKELHQKDEHFTGISLSRNRGHQKALWAGLTTAVEYADMIISIDADLQDDPACIEMMVDKYHEGYDVCNGVRGDRKSDSFFKRLTAQTYYKIMKSMGVELIYNSADCRLLSKRACEALLEYKEDSLFIRGLIPQIGFKQCEVHYCRNKREAGESKYGIKQMFNLAGNGIYGFSLKPITMLRNFGLFLLLGGIISLILCSIFITSMTWVHLINVGIILTSFVILALYGVAIYIGKIHIEVKKRPKYFIETNLLDE